MLKRKINKKGFVFIIMKHKKFKVVDTYNNPLILSYLCGFPIAEARYDVVTP